MEDTSILFPITFSFKEYFTFVKDTINKKEKTKMKKAFRMKFYLCCFPLSRSR